MQLLEHQAKKLLAAAGLPVPSSLLIHHAEQLSDVTVPTVLKSQVPIGGRGKLGGVRLVKTTAKLSEIYRTIKNLTIKNHLPKTILAEEVLEIKKEYYISLQLNRDMRRIEWLVSCSGGIEIEQHAHAVKVLAQGTPKSYHRVAKTLDLPLKIVQPLLQNIEKCFFDNDCLLLEINPLVMTADKTLMCADAKITIDDNARFRQPDLPWHDDSLLRPLGGTIGVIANGAGMAMSTMDTIYAAGGTPANFLDIGGGTGKDVFVTYLRQINELPGVSSIIINIFAGITRCDDIAEGIIAAQQDIADLVPLYIRLEGTRRDEAAALLKKAHITMQPDLASCVRLALKNDHKSVKTSRHRQTTVSAQSAKRLGHRYTLPELRRKTIVFQNDPTVVQGITGHHGAFHTEKMLNYGTDIVAGVTPGKAGQFVHDIPVYDSVADAQKIHQIKTSVIFVPARFAAGAMREALDAGVKLIVCITEGIPVHDMLEIKHYADVKKATIIGPNCPGMIVPGSHKLGIIASHIVRPGTTAIISRSGTLTYELADALTRAGIGQSIVLGIGGDPIQGLTFVEALTLCNQSPAIKTIIVIGEIGGRSELAAADYVAEHVKKPVYGLIVGHSLPPGQTFGHAGAIVSQIGEGADEKTTYMQPRGIAMSTTLDELIMTLTDDLGTK